MLLMARLEEPRTTHAECADPEEAVRLCVGKLWPFLEQAEVRVEVYWPERTLAQRGEPGQVSFAARLVLASFEELNILFSNLLVNAVQHSGPGSSVVVRAREEASGVSITLTDQGEGISAEALPHIFERFYRADTSRARETGGAGLGLSIAKAIVDGAGGMINVTSTLGRGTEICVFLPFMSYAEGVSAKPEHAPGKAFR